MSLKASNSKDYSCYHNLLWIFNKVYFILNQTDAAMPIPKFKAGKTYLISDKEKLNIIKITVLPYNVDAYYIHWHDDGKGQCCCQLYFDECFDIVKELPKENIL